MSMVIKVGQYPTTSGRDGITDTGVKNFGPIPKGTYVLDPSEVSEGNIVRDFLGDWGEYRVPLQPLHNTDTKGRDGFFLHGGEIPGSAGCLDVGENDNTIFDWIKQYKKPITVKIYY